ncbi:MAG: hypothetical protein M1813_001352 [Trichoglossum hirsutum]|nr:MAG: hypothetical protein M1813_001352 [Trichoglossum hirsutum]
MAGAKPPCFSEEYNSPFSSASIIHACIVQSIRLVRLGICYRLCSWWGDGDKSLYAKTGSSPFSKESEKYSVKLRTKRLWRELKAKLFRFASTSDTTTTRTAGKGDIAPLKPPETPHKPPPSSEKAAADATNNKHVGHPSSNDEASLNSMFGSGPPKIIDIAIHKAKGKDMLHRCALLKIESFENFMASDVLRDLGMDMNTYDQGPIMVLDQKGIVPVGQVQAEWYLAATGKTYAASFLVIDTEHFDVLLGGPVIKEYQLHKFIPPREGHHRANKARQRQ